MDFNQELSKARKIAEYAIKHRTFSSKDVKHIGLKSMIANQILRKFGNQRKARRVKSVKLIIPNQGIKLSKDSTTIEIPCLKRSFQYRFPSFEKLNQIEIGKEYVYVTVTVKEQESIKAEKYLGIDLNATGHVAVVANPDTGKVWKLGRQIEHIHKKYKNMRKQLQSQGRYKKLKQIKNRESRIIKNLNHHISKKIVDIAVKAKTGIRLERLDGIRKKKENKYKRNLQNTLHSWSSYQLQTQIGYKTRLLGIPVEYIDPHYTSQICSKCRHMGQREGKNFKCLDCGHVDHADVNASFNIGKPIPPHILDQFDIDRDISKGSSDTPKEATLINDKDLETMKPLESPRF
jgi:putative transposase